VPAKNETRCLLESPGTVYGSLGGRRSRNPVSASQTFLSAAELLQEGGQKVSLQGIMGNVKMWNCG